MKFFKRILTRIIRYWPINRTRPSLSIGAIAEMTCKSRGMATLWSPGRGTIWQLRVPMIRKSLEVVKVAFLLAPIYASWVDPKVEARRTCKTSMNSTPKIPWSLKTTWRTLSHLSSVKLNLLQIMSMTKANSVTKILHKKKSKHCMASSRCSAIMSNKSPSRQS